MLRNTVQFQKWLSEPAFELQYGTEEQFLIVFLASWWPNGFLITHLAQPLGVWYK